MPEDLRCGVCATPLGEAVRRCPACDTPHHHDCWEFAEGCAVYGCSQRLAATRPGLVPAIRRALPAATAPAVEPPPLAAARAAARTFVGALAHAPEGMWKALGAAMVLVAPLPGLTVMMMVLGYAGRPISFLLIFAGLLYAGAAILMVTGGMPAFLRDLAGSLAPRRLDTPDARKRLEARLAEAPGSVHLLEALGLELLRLGELGEAIEVYDRALAARPGNQQAAFYKARCLLEADRGEAARAVLRQVVHLDPATPVAQRAELLLEKLGP